MYEVHSPIGDETIQQSSLAANLSQLDGITIGRRNTLHCVVVKDRTSKTQFTAAMTEPVLAPCSCNWVREIGVGGDASNQSTRKTSSLSTRISMNGVAGMLGKVPCSDSPRDRCR